MKFMKLGSRPDTFFTAESIRSVSSEVSTDIKIQVQNNFYHLHKFPLLSKSGRLQTLCAKDSAVYLSDIPGGADAFEVCAKFCYGISITVSPLNFVPLRCAAEYLLMTDAVDRGNLVGKLESFFNSCILRRWKDTLLTLQSTRLSPSLCEDLRITARCVEALSAAVPASKGAWMDEMAELGMDHYWRIMIAVKSAGVVPAKIVGEALQAYAGRWLTNMETEVTTKHRLLLEKIVSLLPAEKRSVSCGFLLKLLKAANVLNASSSTKLDLSRRAGAQLEEATVNDLLIPYFSNGDDETLYDVDAVIAIVEEFMLQGRSPPTSPTRGKAEITARRRSRSAENVDFEGLENSRRSSSASHGSMLRVAKLVDLYLREIAGDEKVPVEKVIALAEAAPEFARTQHDDLYRVVDTYLRAHPQLDKKQRKKLCRILDCKKLSTEASAHAAQNDMLPLRVVVQVLFFEQARAAMTGGHVTELPGNIKALLTKAADCSDKGSTKCSSLPGVAAGDEHWSSAARSKCQAKTTKVTPSTLRMKLEEDDNDTVEEAAGGNGVMTRSSSSRFRALCAIPGRQKRILSKFWSVNRR
ncbi:BTB/POZ domain-containing protein [Platanthera guangdongensis]|uniref:BTB/POZ domain-containing protein n=1 Tax=Platanthera guangdongensis TaxID=2320717 RepID=A0ABR2M2L8_9ASPA